MLLSLRIQWDRCAAALILTATFGCAADRAATVSPNLAPAPTVLFRPVGNPDPPPSSASVQPIAATVPVGPSLVKPTSGSEDVPPPAPNGRSAAPAQPNLNPIDLATALRLADAGNLQVAFAREQVRQALARADRAGLLWIPSIRGGVSFNNHEGSIQNVAGPQIDTNRGAVYLGMGATAYGNGSPALSGIYANFSLADAIFQPLAARQLVGARRQAAAAEQNDTLLRVALAYLDLTRAIQEAAIAGESRDLTQHLAELTGNYAKAGEGLQADADRMQAELTVRLNDVERAQEGIAVASARLAQLIRLDPTIPLSPIEPSVVPIEMAPMNVPLRELIAEGMSQRPELAEERSLVAEAAAHLRGEELGPLLPHVVLGVSEGDMSSGEGPAFTNLQDRFDLDAIAYWELRNFGFGDRAARNESRSQVQQAQIRQFDAADRIVREIVEAYAQVHARRKEIETARRGIQSAVDSHRHNLERIQAAKGLPIEALQSVQALAQARREYLRTVFEYDAAQFSLYRAIGAPVLQYSEQANLHPLNSRPTLE
jgi:outer membrane protein TolC